MSKQCDFDVIARHYGRVEGYLLGMSAPIEVQQSLRGIMEQFESIDQQLDFNNRIDEHLNASPVVESGGRKRWSDKDKAEIWKMRFTDEMKPAEIAEKFEGRKGADISNLIQQMKASGYSPAA